jgi:hypothetical protein
MLSQKAETEENKSTCKSKAFKACILSQECSNTGANQEFILLRKKRNELLYEQK